MNAVDEIRRVKQQNHSIEIRLNNVRQAGGPGFGEVNTASNIGAGGVGPYAQKVGVDLQFRNINAGSARITVALDAGNNEIDVDVVPGQIDHNSLLNYDANEHIDHTTVSVIAGTGLSGGGTIAADRTINLSHLGIQNLADPGADRIMFWDETANAMKWLSLGNSLNIVLTVMDTIQDIRTVASPQFAGMTLTHNLIFSGATTRQIMRDVDNQPMYISGGSQYTHGASLQFYGEDHVAFPGNAYIVSGSHDASPASIIQFAYRNAGAYQAIMTLGADRHIDIWDWNDGVMREIDFGADNSGGAGFKVLRVPN